MVNVDDSWQYYISGLTAQVWGLAATWCSVCIHQMNQVNSCNGFGHDVHVINIIKALLGHIACTECRDAACTVDTDVPWCVCLSVDISLSCAKTDKPIEMLFGIWTRWPQGTMYLYEVEAQIPLIFRMQPFIKILWPLVFIIINPIFCQQFLLHFASVLWRLTSLLCYCCCVWW